MYYRNELRLLLAKMVQQKMTVLALPVNVYYLLYVNFPKLKIIVVEDALASNAPHIRLLEDLSFSYILVAKPSDHAYMFKMVEEHKANDNVSQLETIDSNNTIRRYNYINNIPLNASHPDLLVNFLEYWEIKDGKQIYHITKITDIDLHQNHVYYIMRGGRARFQYENETFNLATKPRL